MDWYISDNTGYVAQVTPSYEATLVFADRKIYLTEAAANTDLATLQTMFPNSGSRFGVHAHNH